ncbi:MAG: sulfatase-like hydrolase/transferase [Armatimonadia bacterium]|nr:sulfatase-like hydrolase/transferase [Armatimonadia bacterium]
MNRRDAIKAGAAAGAGLLMGQAGAWPEREGSGLKTPNLLFVFSDQHSWDMLGCYGNDQIISPNLDRFASQGTRFEHCISSSPVCTPYRSMLVTGQHPLYNGCFTNDVQLRTDLQPGFGEILRAAGYRTGWVGKWHLLGGHRNRPIPPGPHRHGFDDTFLSNNCHVDYRPGNCYYWTEEGEKVFFDEWEVFGQTRQALRFLDEADGDQPFALFVSWHPPHDWGKFADGTWRYDTIPELMGLYDPDRIRLRPNHSHEDYDVRSYHGHMAMISGVDQAFGWLMEKLRQKGLDRDTLVVFTSDHGDMLGSHGRPFPKTAPEDESVRVPLMMRLPGTVPEDHVSDLMVGTLDLMPTVLGLMGLPVPDYCHGSALDPEVRTGSDGAAESVPLFLFPGNWRGVYTRDVTYAVDCPQAPRPQFRVLYQKSRDPRQLINLFEEESHAPLRQEMHRLTLEWMDRYGDPFVDVRTLMDRCVKGSRLDIREPESTGETLGRPIDLIQDVKL